MPSAENPSTEDAFLNIADTVMRHLPNGGKILDFGCGPMDKTAVLARLGYQCVGYDDLNDPWHRVPGNLEKIKEFARRESMRLDLAADGPMPYEKNSFDLVMSNDVFEHIHDSPRELVNDLVEFLKPGGFLMITVPNAVNIRKRLEVLRGRTNLPGFDGFYWLPGSWRGHVREYVRGDLVAMNKYLKLDMVELRGCDHMLVRVPKRFQKVYVAITNLADGLKDSWTYVGRKPEGWQPQREIPEEQRKLLTGYVMH